MYDELIKALHDGAEFLECSTPGIENSFAKMCHNAADAIEELQQQNEQLVAALDRLACELQFTERAEEGE